MFGHVAGRQHPLRWLILSFLFAVALGWSFAVMGDRIGTSWGILRLGLAVALGVSLLRLLTSMSSRRRRARTDARLTEGDGGAAMAAGGRPSAEEPPTEERPLTYGEIFHGEEPDLDGAIDQVEAIKQVEAIEADLEAQESLRRMREAFKARAKEAELRVKQREAELDEAPSTSKSP